MIRRLIILLLIVGCERYEDKGKQRPNLSEYETRFDKWRNSIQYNVNGEWLTIEEYKNTEYYQSKWREIEIIRKKERTVQENIAKFRNQSLKPQSFNSLEDAQNKIREQALQK